MRNTVIGSNELLFNHMITTVLRHKINRPGVIVLETGVGAIQVANLLKDLNATAESKKRADAAKRLVIPLMPTPGHFALAVVDKVNRKIVYQDSLGSPITPELRKVLSAQFPGFELQDARIRQQDNGFDCGVLTIRNAVDLVSSDKPIDASQIQIRKPENQTAFRASYLNQALLDVGYTTPEVQTAQPQSLSLADTKQGTQDVVSNFKTILAQAHIVSQQPPDSVYRESTQTHLLLTATRTINSLIEANVKPEVLDKALNDAINAYEALQSPAATHQAKQKMETNAAQQRCRQPVTPIPATVVAKADGDKKPATPATAAGMWKPAPAASSTTLEHKSTPAEPLRVKI